MSTPISSIARAGRLRFAGMACRRTGVLAAWMLAVGALAAGCGSAHSGPSASAPAAVSTAASGRAAGHATVPAAPSATPVLTVSGGSAAAGGVACAGWPADATSASLPASFVPVIVERCVNGVRTIPGKGLWATATLQRADSGLTGLINALRRPSVAHKSGTVCPAIAIIPPQVVLIGAKGQKLIPRFPVTACGVIQSQVLAALNGLRWQPVSIRLLYRISGGTPPKVSGTSPRSIQTVGGQVA